MSKLKAINWNDPSCKFYNDIYTKQIEQMWVAEEIPVSEDRKDWGNLDNNVQVAYERVLAGLTLLDTNQTTGINKIAERSDNLFIQALLSLFGGFESIHARSYSTIFQTLVTPKHIDELFEWVENTKELQGKLHKIISQYTDSDSLFMSYVGSLCLEGVCFYSGFFLPLYLAGQGKMVHSGEVINLIMRDEKLHTLACGKFAQDLYNEMSIEKQQEYKDKAISLIKEVYELELEYSHLIYDDLNLFDDVKTYVEFNVNYALECLDFEPMFTTTKDNVNAIVMNGYSIDTKNHDFFSGLKGNGYVKTTKVELLKDEDFKFDWLD